MTTLHDRLADLADEQDGGGLPPTGLWEQGRRLHRRRRAGTAAIVATAVVLLAGVVGLDRSRSSVDVEPAGPATELGLPDRLYLPDPHLAGTDDTGPIGPLSVVTAGVRKDWSGDQTSASVGISGTGEYAFLDLPGAAALDGFRQDGNLALSADGTKLAYWLSGEPAGAYGGPPELEAYVGLAVYDTVTGEVWRRPIETEHGLSPMTMRWAGDTLWFEVWQYYPPQEEGAPSRRTHLVAWDPVSDTAKVFDRTGANKKLWGLLQPGATWRGNLVLFRDGAVHVVGADGVEVRPPLPVTPEPQGPVHLSPEGGRVAALRDTDEDGVGSNEPEPIVVGRGPAEPSATPLVLQDVPDADAHRVDELLGWRDESHVVGRRRVNTVEDLGVVSVDVETGHLEVLIPFNPEVYDQILASDALGGEVFEATAPPSPLDPRLVWGLGVGIVLLAAVLLVAWRRRVLR